MTKPNDESVKHDRSTDELKDQHEKDPRAELGLKSPREDQKSEEKNEGLARTEAQGRKATMFDGNPNPEGTNSPAQNKDDTPMRLKKTEGPR